MNQKWKSLPNAGTLITADDLAGIWLREGSKCYLCGTEVELMKASFDHVVPWAEGGIHSVGNIRLCCVACQRSKYTKTPEQYGEYQKLMRSCLTCRKRFRPRWADYVRGYGHYCSRKCSGKAAKHG